MKNEIHVDFKYGKNILAIYIFNIGFFFFFFFLQVFLI